MLAIVLIGCSVDPPDFGTPSEAEAGADDTSGQTGGSTLGADAGFVTSDPLDAAPDRESGVGDAPETGPIPSEGGAGIEGEAEVDAGDDDADDGDGGTDGAASGFDGELGAGCQVDADCQSGFCVDEICCAEDCSGLCSTCAATGDSCVAPETDPACEVSCQQSTACVIYPDSPLSSCSALGECESEAELCEPTFEPRGTSCGAAEECDGLGSCESICDADQTYCDDRCFDLSSSEYHCGACFQGCFLGSVCGAGSCTNPDPFDLSTLEDDGDFGFVVDGDPEEGDTKTACAGIGVAMLGDINGDGLSDVGVGGFQRAHVVYGSVSTATVDLSRVSTRGFAIVDSAGGISSGDEIVSAGDFNGDGTPDYMVANPSSNAAGVLSAGEVYVIYGAADSDDIDMADLGGGGVTIEGYVEFGVLRVGASAGDVNGDGLDDLLFRYSDEGRSFVVLGSVSTQTINLGNLGNAGYYLVGPSDSSHSISGAGDVNGDGLNDVIVGLRTTANAAVVFGSESTDDVSMTNLGDRGFLIENLASLPSLVAEAGDVNGDGLDDLLLTSNGGASVVFGRSETTSISLDTLGSDGFSIAGSFTALAPAGDVNGDGLDDILLADSDATGVDGQETAGGVFVVYGKTDTEEIDVTDLGSSGRFLLGLRTGDNVGETMAGGGDVNGDGLDDIIIGSRCPVDEKSGAYVVFSVDEVE